MNFAPPKPDRLGLRLALAACAAGLSTSAGCALFRGDDAGPVATTRPATTRESYGYDQPVPPSLQPMNRPVVQGQLPLIYLVESECSIRVSNVNSGEEIATFPAKASQIVRVEPRGVLLAERPVLGASLAAGTYAIEVVAPPDAGSLRVIQTRTRVVPPPATRPASQ